ncbi:eotaxin-like [Ambystoma mexicanum]|uniref:eotaxin-like n=1 Tax=Ambystoma mexicanum TaxID=8296 RepID=UPI0037E86D22
MARLPKLALLLLLAEYASVLGDSYFRPSKVETHCCKSVSAHRFPYTITRVKQQAALYPCVKAVIFYTNETGPICSDPKVPWVKKKLREVKKKGKNGKPSNPKKRRPKPPGARKANIQSS